MAEISSEWLEKLECATVRARIGAVVRCHPIVKDAESLSEIKANITELFVARYSFTLYYGMVNFIPLYSQKGSILQRLTSYPHDRVK